MINELCDRAEVQTRVSAVRGAADCASDHSSQNVRNANSTFLLTETLGNLQFLGVLKSHYIAGQWLNLCERVAFLILDLLSLSRIYHFVP